MNNAGVAVMSFIEDTSWEDFDWVVGVDFWGVAHGTKAFLPHLIASGDGHVVNVSSTFRRVGAPNQGAYNAAKFAVRGFTEALSQEMVIARHPVRVMCVFPGAARTVLSEVRTVSVSVNATRPHRSSRRSLASALSALPGRSPEVWRGKESVHVFHTTPAGVQ
uniref:Putative short chain dehydrogenase n=1 Tax=Amycolatopsis sp. SANK 60206 TaxID=1642649 RepID=A0A0E3USM5_9PSEU|nr:putative short chain dehydrogenase [Amycolatopsis sp. SANK 60206]